MSVPNLNPLLKRPRVILNNFGCRFCNLVKNLHEIFKLLKEICHGLCMDAEFHQLCGGRHIHFFLEWSCRYDAVAQHCCVAGVYSSKTSLNWCYTQRSSIHPSDVLGLGPGVAELYGLVKFCCLIFLWSWFWFDTHVSSSLCVGGQLCILVSMFSCSHFWDWVPLSREG